MLIAPRLRSSIINFSRWPHRNPKKRRKNGKKSTKYDIKIFHFLEEKNRGTKKKKSVKIDKQSVAWWIFQALFPTDDELWQ